MSARRALVTGITGQDGSYLAELLLKKGYEVFGLVRRSSSDSLVRVRHLTDQLTLISGDLLDAGSLTRAVDTARPDEVYNLAAQSFVPASFGQPVLTGQVTAMGAARMLEAVRDRAPGARYYQASSSEMFGTPKSAPQNESTPFRPRSPYGVAKVYAHHLTVNYREAYGLFACSGILFNHTSPRRGLEFVTRKVCRAAARIARGLDRTVSLGNLDAHRDWGWAPDYVDAMWRMLQADEAQDLVVATGESHSVRDLCSAAFSCVDLEWEDHVETDGSLLRPADVDNLVGDTSQARKVLEWTPSVTFYGLVERLVAAELTAIDEGAAS